MILPDRGSEGTRDVRFGVSAVRTPPKLVAANFTTQSGIALFEIAGVNLQPTWLEKTPTIRKAQPMTACIVIPHLKTQPLTKTELVTVNDYQTAVGGPVENTSTFAARTCSSTPA